MLEIHMNIIIITLTSINFKPSNKIKYNFTSKNIKNKNNDSMNLLFHVVIQFNLLIPIYYYRLIFGHKNL